MATTTFAAPMTPEQATAETFFNRMNRADLHGMPGATQLELHERWAATTTIREKLAVCEALHLTLLTLENK